MSNVKDADEIVKNGINGLIVQQDNAEELAKTINYICNNPELALKMGRNGFYDGKKNQCS